MTSAVATLAADTVFADGDTAAAALPDLALIEKVLAERSLVDFTEQAWHLIEPRTPFVNNWHIGAMAAHLEAITDGTLTTDLLFNVPPGSMKSILISVMWQCWEWGPRKQGHYRYLCGSYDESISIRDNLKARIIIESPWYQARWPVKLRYDQNTKTRYDNEATGWRIATSVGGRGTGEHPHRKIIDDPHNVKRSLSPVSRREVINWFGLTLGSRGAALDARTIVAMQRLHDEDLSGHILAELRDEFTYICLPQRYEPPTMIDGVLIPRMATTPIGFQDPRSVSGELLWPALFTPDRVAKVDSALRAAHGEFGVAGQQQQRPVPEKGGMFKESWLPVVEAAPAAATVVRRARGWDCAATADGGDYSVGVRMSLTKGGIVYIEDVVRGQWGPDEFEGENGIMRSTVVSDGRAVAQREEQEPGSAGKKVIAEHMKLMRGYPYIGIPSTGDKATRAKPFRNQASVGNVRLVRGEWNRAYIRELCAFPNGTYDDQVDGSSSGYDELTSDRYKPSACTW